MRNLSPDEKRRRIVEVARMKGVDCPAMIVEWAAPVLGGGQINYRCSKDAAVEYLSLTPEEAEYVGIDMSVT